MNREVLIPQNKIQERVKELARWISSDYAGREPLFIGILNGAVFFFTDLVKELTIPSRIDFIRAASYGSAMTSSGAIRLLKDVELPVAGKDLIVVEDIVDTGLTLTHIIRMLEERGPNSIRLCALIDKKERREQAVTIDYCGFQVEQGYLIGYGLDYDEQYRYLRDICVLK